MEVESGEVDAADAAIYKPHTVEQATSPNFLPPDL